MDLAGFNAAAGNPPIMIDFDAIPAGTDITGSTLSGVTLSGPGAALIVVEGGATFTPAGFSGVIDAATNKLFSTSGLNVLSPGGLTLGPGPDGPVENDDVTLVFGNPVSVFGFDHLSQSADGWSYTGIRVFDPSNNLLFSGTLPISNIGGIGNGGPGAADFFGIVSDTANIKRIVIDETDGDNVYPDSNIGFDTFRWEPGGPGDVDDNGVVDGLDLTAVITAWMTQPGDLLWNPDADLDESNVVDGLDLTEVISHWSTEGGAAAVPEPGVCALLALGGLAAIRRRRPR